MDSRLFNPGASVAETQSAIAAEDWKLLRYLGFYRLVIAGMAAAYALTGERISPFGETFPDLFMVTALLYAGVALGSSETLRRSSRLSMLPVSPC